MIRKIYSAEDVLLFVSSFLFKSFFSFMLNPLNISKLIQDFNLFQEFFLTRNKLDIFIHIKFFFLNQPWNETNFKQVQTRRLSLIFSFTIA